MTYATKAISEAIIEVQKIASPDDLSDVLTRCIDATGITRCINEVLTKSIDRTWSARYTGSPLPNTTSGAAALRFHSIDLAFRKTSLPVPLDFMCMRPTFSQRRNDILLSGAIAGCFFLSQHF